jgi:hypothetical protein
MLWGDVELKQDSSGTEYLEFTERVSKTRQGSTWTTRALRPKIFATGKITITVILLYHLKDCQINLFDNECVTKCFSFSLVLFQKCLGTTCCSVNVYKEYDRHRPEDCRNADSRFFLCPIREPPAEQWFTRQAMGKNTTGSLGKRLAQTGNLSSKKTNHSARKSGISMLLHDNVPPTEVMQISGHRNIQSPNSYSSLSIKQQQCLSNKLFARIANEPAAVDNGLSIGDTSRSSLSTASSSASRVGVTTSMDDLLQLPPEIETQLFDDFEMPMEFEFRSSVPSVSHLPASRPVSHLPDSALVLHQPPSAIFSHLPASASILYLQGASVHGNIIIKINQPGHSL